MVVAHIEYGSAKRLNEIAKNYFSEIERLGEHHVTETEENCQSTVSTMNLVGRQNKDFDADKFLADFCKEFLDQEVSFRKPRKENYWDRQVYRFEETKEDDNCYKFIQIIYTTSNSFVSTGELTVYFKHTVKKS